jgi:hypothetical protein
MNLDTVDNYIPDEFYDTRNLTLDQKKEILKDARDLSLDWHVDLLDARKSWARKKIEMSFEEILEKLDDKCHFVFIHRKGFKGDGIAFRGEYQLEIGFATILGDPSYFLFIHCDEEKLSEFLTKYHLVKQLR